MFAVLPSFMSAAASEMLVHSFIHSLIIHSFIHSVVWLTTGPQPFPKRVFHRVRSSLPLSVSSTSRFLVGAYVFVLIFPSLLSFYLSFNHVLQKIVPTQDLTNPVSLLYFYYMYDIALLQLILSALLQHHISKLR